MVPSTISITTEEENCDTYGFIKIKYNTGRLKVNFNLRSILSGTLSHILLFISTKVIKGNAYRSFIKSAIFHA